MSRFSMLPLVLGSVAGFAAPLSPASRPHPVPPSHAHADPAVGSGKGWLIIQGGGVVTNEETERFVALAGGPEANFVVIPTALGDGEFDLAGYKNRMAEWFHIDPAHITVLHTRSKDTANTEAFAEPLKHATGVWLDGGRQWRLADAYNGTAVQREIKALVARGGVVFGGSAGATIQGAFLVRGQSAQPGNPDGDNTIMMSPDHEVGFGLLPNSAVDQHVDARGRDADLDTVIATHPDLLGIGIYQGAAIVVHGESFFVIDGKALIHDNKVHDGKRYYYLNAGQAFNLRTRTIDTSKGHVLSDPAMFPLLMTAESGHRAASATGTVTTGDATLTSRADASKPSTTIKYSCNGAIYAKNEFPARSTSDHDLIIELRALNSDQVTESSCKY